MEGKAKQEELISFFKNKNYDEDVIKQAKDDFEAGLSVEQVSIYKVRRLKQKERLLISKGFRLGIPFEMISGMVDHRYKEAQFAAVVSEYESGTEISVIKEVLDEFRTGHDITETFKQVKERMADTKEKPAETDITEGNMDDNATEASDTVDKTASAGSGAISGKDFIESMKMVMDTFSNTMQMQFERMDKRDEELRNSLHDKETEKFLNDRITNLESQLADSKKDLSAASGVVNEKEKQIHSLQVDVDIRIKELFQKDEEIKKLREEIERMKTENNSNGEVNQSAGKSSVSETGKSVVSENKANHTANYTMNVTMPNGKQIPLQVERDEKKSQSGLSALMSKFLPKGPAKTLLTRMIEGRYSGKQLSEVMYAYQNHLEEAEVQELLDANLPPEEMHGIINVVAAAKGGEE